MDVSPRRLTEIPRAEALSLLAGVTLGRVVYTDRAMPAARLVSHLIEAADIVIRNDYGVAIARGGPDRSGGPAGRAESGIVVAYEADEIDPFTGLGWSVVVTGTALAVRDTADIARYERALRPWSRDGATAGQFIRIHPGIVTGYRFLPQFG